MYNQTTISRTVYLTKETNTYFSSQVKYYSLKAFWVGLMIYTFSYVIKGSPHFNLKIGELTQFIGLLIMLPSFLNIMRFRIRSGYLSLLVVLYLIWAGYIIARGIHFNYPFLKDSLLNADSGILIYLTPLIILVPKESSFFSELFKTIFIFGIFYFICNIYFIVQLLDRSFETQNVIENLVWNLSMPCGFVLLTYKYHPDKRKIVCFISITLSLLFALYRARRGLTTILTGIMISGYFIYLFNTRKKIIIIYLTVLFACLGIFYATSIYSINDYKLFNFIAQRGTTDTRAEVEDYFYTDMDKKDWIIGKGLNGEYFCPNIDPNQISDYRDYIETGYLQIILKGGLVRLILYLLISIPAIILGLFFSKNILSKAASIWIAIAILSLYPASVVSYSLEYLLVWISISVCYTKKIRNLTDIELIEFFKANSEVT
jgi:hypothetical protein